jgi:hypothetical protein
MSFAAAHAYGFRARVSPSLEWSGSSVQNSSVTA